MKTLIRIVIGIFAVLGAIFLSLSVFSSFFPNNCEYLSFGSISSPDNQFRAKQVLWNCEKEDYIRTEVRLIKVDGNPRMSWGAFGVRSKRLGEGSAFRPVPIEVSWLTDRKLKITYPSDADVFMLDNDVEGIDVTFVKTDTMSR